MADKRKSVYVPLTDKGFGTPEEVPEDNVAPPAQGASDGGFLRQLAHTGAQLVLGEDYYPKRYDRESDTTTLVDEFGKTTGLEHGDTRGKTLVDIPMGISEEEFYEGANKPADYSKALDRSGADSPIRLVVPKNVEQYVTRKMKVNKGNGKISDEVSEPKLTIPPPDLYPDVNDWEAEVLTQAGSPPPPKDTGILKGVKDFMDGVAGVNGASDAVIPNAEERDKASHEIGDKAWYIKSFYSGNGTEYASEGEVAFKTLNTHPDKLGQYARVLQAAKDNGTFEATHYVLQQKDAKYRQLLKDLRDSE